jgi:V/A-type H+-transporting ATPase subunit D
MEAIRKTFVGVVVPEIRFRKKERNLPMTYTSESIYLDIARLSFIRATELILELSSIEIKVWRLARELRKTVIRVNALKNYYLPTYRREIRQIETSLAESEREFLSILKHLTRR